MIGSHHVTEKKPQYTNATYSQSTMPTSISLKHAENSLTYIISFSVAKDRQKDYLTTNDWKCSGSAGNILNKIF